MVVGRAPASHNALVAYTPSRGLISVRGNWPLVPTMDVVVPHTRSMDDLRSVLDAVVVDDPVTDGDLWRTQPWIALPRPSEVRPDSFAALEPLPLAGLRMAIPRIYINGDPGNASPIVTRDSVMRLWTALRADLEAAGAEVVETDFPVVDRYEKLHPGDEDFLDRGFVTREFLDDEVGDLAVWAMDAFLRQNGDPALDRLADADASRIFPTLPALSGTATAPGTTTSPTTSATTWPGRRSGSPTGARCRAWKPVCAVSSTRAGSTSRSG